MFKIFDISLNRLRNSVKFEKSNHCFNLFWIMAIHPVNIKCAGLCGLWVDINLWCLAWGK